MAPILRAGEEFCQRAAVGAHGLATSQQIDLLPGFAVDQPHRAGNIRLQFFPGEDVDERGLPPRVEQAGGATRPIVFGEQIAEHHRHAARAEEIRKALYDCGIRAKVDDRSEKIGYKIREARMQRLPYWIVVGDKEVEDGSVAVSHRGEGDIGSFGLDALTARLTEEIRTKAK